MFFVHVKIYRLLGLNVVEVAHDMCASVSNYVKNGLKLTNSYDTWHGNIICCASYMSSLLQLLRDKECKEVD